MELPLGSGPSRSNNTPEFVGDSAPKDQSLLPEQNVLDTVRQETSKTSIIASLLAQSSRHLFGPTSAPSLPLKHQVVSIDGLLSKIGYLKPEEVRTLVLAIQERFSPTEFMLDVGGRELGQSVSLPLALELTASRGGILEPRLVAIGEKVPLDAKIPRHLDQR